MLKPLTVLLAASLVPSGCVHAATEADDRPTHTIDSVRRAMADRGLPLRPAPLAERMGRLAVSERVRRSEAGERIVGYVIADTNPLARSKPSYLIVVTVFDSAEAADDALKVEPRWVRSTTGRVRTAQFRKDNLVATYGGRNTDEGLAELRSALDALPAMAPTP